MKNKISIIGGGNMGTAILSGIQRKFAVSICEKDAKRGQYLKKKFKVAVDDVQSVVTKSGVIILAVKPQDFDQILAEVRPFINKDKLVISIAAGIPTLYIEKRLGAKVRVIRTMPNLPAQIGEGMTGICKGKWASSADLSLACKIFNNIGQTVIVEEKWIDAITAVSGSGPAYVFLFVECFIKAARALGFDEKQSKQLVAQTIHGSLNLLESQNEEAGVLRSRVTSKGGTTQAAMDVFFRRDIEGIFVEALTAAQHRAKQLSK